MPQHRLPPSPPQHSLHPSPCSAMASATLPPTAPATTCCVTPASKPSASAQPLTTAASTPSVSTSPQEPNPSPCPTNVYLFPPSRQPPSHQSFGQAHHFSNPTPSLTSLLRPQLFLSSPSEMGERWENDGRTED